MWWHTVTHGRGSEGERRKEWVASALHTTSEYGVSSITTAHAHTSAASSQLNWRPRRFKWTSPFRRKTKCGFCACAITFQTQSTVKFCRGCSRTFLVHLLTKQNDCYPSVTDGSKPTAINLTVEVHSRDLYWKGGRVLLQTSSSPIPCDQTTKGNESLFSWSLKGVGNVEYSKCV